MNFEKRKRIQKALALTQEGHYDKAIAEYEAILGADPSDSFLLNTLGDLYAHIGSTPEAIAWYQKLAEALKADGLFYRAIAVYKKIIKLDPNNTSALIACADLYAEEELQTEAKRLYLLAVERFLKLGLDKQAPDVCNLATASQSIGELKRAVAILRDLWTEGPSIRDATSRARELEGQGAQDAGFSGVSEKNVNATRQTRTG